ncbi:divalent cation transporter [Marine Group I thaumarchaeote]|uniref:Divalent cation transporter n=1 Tax=Marine Group I thaumarchaeote TaxID=2511932 RepID=A0A7K4MTA2_9ARCH|nr:MAG: divalent cation transporter [Nitrosopumilus sp. YT1]NMI81782.1 divalent cation transporter [Candidatus Nitrosopumilus sp. MTA1]NWJ19720.1 divalent cation transporter [Marine Group I thaumarchaeote]NWJ28115.1 divalent cation transporter [Marine Group I thaumarchaeote]NWJ56712.1 divalent cation transporter [Marine Group I thaumarchaeote]
MELSNNSSKGKLFISGIIPFAFLVILILYIFGPGSDLLDFGIPLPEITIEKVDFVDSEIQVTVRNTGPIPVEVVMADVNDRIRAAAVEPDGFLERFETTLVRIPYEWNLAQPYIIGITIEDGTRFEKEIEAAAPALKPSFDLVIFFAVIGTYVGIIPVMIGLLWLPFIKRISKQKYHFFLALTIGLLFFLAIDSIEEAIDVSDESLAGIFNGTLLVATVIVLSFLGLYYFGDKLVKKADSLKITKPVAIALMISIGIGIHNFGEGLAIGAAIGIGSIAFSTFLIVGFALHNTTEGIAIAAPMSRGKLMLGKLAAMGLIAGSPAIFGAWVGGFVYSPFTSVIFLAIGAGAIFQVIVVIMKWIREEGDKNLSSAAVVSGFAVGMLVMYLTSILV